MFSVKGKGSNPQFLHLITPESIQVNYLSSSFVANPTYSIDSIFPTLISNDEIVKVSFSSSNPSASDWIGAYSPSEADITRTAPVLYGCCTGSCTGSPKNSYLTSNTGSLSFNMTNLRSGIKFYYFTNGTEAPAVVASSNQIVTFLDVNEPLRNRVVPSGNPNIYYLYWSTANATTPFMKWGLSSGHYEFQSNGSRSFIERSEFCAAPANSTGYRSLGTINNASFIGIDEMNLYNQDIFYIFGDSLLNLTSSEKKFHIPPKSGSQPPNRPTSVALMADLGVGVTDSSIGTEVFDTPCPPAINTTMSITQRLINGELDGIILTGDISYANGYMTTWDFFLDMVSPMAGGCLFFTTMGNHESDSSNSDAFYPGNSSGGECTVA